MRQLVLGVFFTLMLLSLVSANGLSINPSTITINKTVGVDENIVFTISNQEPYSFFNISVDNTEFPYISFTQITELASGSNATVTAKITANENINSTVRVKGFYISNVGEQNKTWDVNITGTTQQDVNPCNFAIIKGDSITWRNVDAFSKLNLRNWGQVDGTGRPMPIDGAIIERNQMFTKKFTEAGQLDYGVFLGDTDSFELARCKIIIHPTTGPINDPNFDGLLTLTIKSNYEPTTVNVLVAPSRTSFIAFTSLEGGILSVVNTGNKTAKKIHLSGDWMSFTENDFDLAVGETNNVEYDIEPAVSSTSETNKSYVKNMSISGNFQTVFKEVNIFVEYRANIDANSSTASEGIDALLRGFCERNPDVCRPIIVQALGNGSQGVSQVNITQEQFKDIWVHIFEQDEARQSLDNYIKEQINSMSNESTFSQGVMQELQTTLQENKESQESSMKGIIIFIIVVFVLVCCAIVGLLIYLRRTQREQAALRRY